jgi:hypothetical protein
MTYKGYYSSLLVTETHLGVPAYRIPLSGTRPPICPDDKAKSVTEGVETTASCPRPCVRRTDSEEHTISDSEEKLLNQDGNSCFDPQIDPTHYISAHTLGGFTPR